MVQLTRHISSTDKAEQKNMGLTSLLRHGGLHYTSLDSTNAVNYLDRKNPFLALILAQVLFTEGRKDLGSPITKSTTCYLPSQVILKCVNVWRKVMKDVIL